MEINTASFLLRELGQASEHRTYPTLLQTRGGSKHDSRVGVSSLDLASSRVDSRAGRPASRKAVPSLSLTIVSLAPESPVYQGCPLEVEVDLQRLEVNWNAVSVNRVLRFFMNMSYVKDAVASIRSRMAEADEFYASRVPGAPSKRAPAGEKPRMGGSGIRDKEHGSHLMKRPTCVDEPTRSMQVRVRISRISVQCIHPQNKTLPVFTLKINECAATYAILIDHTEISGSMGNLRILDNTSYPYTADPRRLYKPEEGVPASRTMPLLGFEVAQGDKAITFDVTSFTYPDEHCCPLQTRLYEQKPTQRYNRLLKLRMKQVKLHYTQELVYRLYEYAYYQILFGATDTDPYSGLEASLKAVRASRVDS
jgi:hypothetical protein